MKKKIEKLNGLNYTELSKLLLHNSQVDQILQLSAPTIYKM